MTPRKRCACGCGRPVRRLLSTARYASQSCRNRVAYTRSLDQRIARILRKDRAA